MTILVFACVLSARAGDGATDTDDGSATTSTHPAEATRIEQIQGWLPEALQYYKK